MPVFIYNKGDYLNVYAISSKWWFTKILVSSKLFFFQIVDEIITPAVGSLEARDASRKIVMALVLVVSSHKLGLLLPEKDWQIICRCLLLPEKKEEALLQEINNHFQDKK